MARTLYGGGGGDVISQLSSDGDFEPSTSTFEVMTSRTGSTQLTDLTSLAGSAISVVTPDSLGRVFFNGPDGVKSTLWLRDTAAPTATRWKVEPVDLGDRLANAFSVSGTPANGQIPIYNSTTGLWAPGAPTAGTSAYQTWLDNGNAGTEQDFLDDLVGAPGATDWASLSPKPNIPGDGIFVAATGTDMSSHADDTVVIFYTPPVVALAYRNHSESDTAAGSSKTPTITVPSNTQVGDLILVCVVAGGNDTLNMPAGWTSDNAQVLTGNTATMTICHKIAVSTDIGATVTFSFLSDTAHFATVMLRTYVGVDVATPIDAGVSMAIGSSTAPSAPAVTSTQTNNYAVAFFTTVDGTSTGPTSWTPPSGYSQGFTRTTSKVTGANAAVAGYHKALASSGSTGAATAAFTDMGGLNRWAAALVVLRHS